ncbi:MAG: polyphosphate kinase 2 [Chloroflexota bacterium]|nr:MAG: polyphosphate kinase 2 [Anaerolineaceae bacterium 4572_5.2]RLD04898.1 MAG: polyphosphate kinase 2 [Chloroflexota bacterium]
MIEKYTEKGVITPKYYEQELRRLQTEMVKLQHWVKNQGLRVIILFEGRDAAGKTEMIKQITQRLNPRIVRSVALGVPSDKEKRQWYYQRYVKHFPAKGEIVFFNRSWYNRAGVEWVMNFCTEDEYRHFLNECPQFERMLIREGFILIKYWLSVSAEEQEKRFQSWMQDPRTRWRLTPIDREARKRWVEYSKAKDAMMAHTNINEAPWYVVNAEIAEHAQLNTIAHILNLITYKDLTPEQEKLPPREEKDTNYVRPPMSEQNFVPEVYGKAS